LACRRSGADQFVLNDANPGADTIADFLRSDGDVLVLIGFDPLSVANKTDAVHF
jgi:Ca2+-binding RTX toxin-like protein